MTDHETRTGQTVQPGQPEPSQLNQPQPEPVVETPVEARSGFLDRPVMIVLAVGLILAVAAGLMVGMGT